MIIRAGFSALALASMSSVLPTTAATAAGLPIAPIAPVAAGYLPTDKDERGLWMQVEDVERRTKTSAFTIRDPALNGYVRDVFCRTVGAEQCAGVRIYIVRTAAFNATMYPNGMMMVYSGLLLRMRDEAQLSAVLGHEYTHFVQRHSLRNFRNLRGKATAMAWMSMIPVPGIGGAALMTLAQLGIAGSVFSFSRAMEIEADAGSIPLMAGAGYDPRAAPKVWEQLREEQDATAAARGKRSHKDDSGGMFGTHPPTAERVWALQDLAATQPNTANPTDARTRYRVAMSPWWPALVDDQVKLNDFGATDLLITRLASDGEPGGGWTPDLLYARGELYRTRGQSDDLIRAAGFYRQAIAAPDAPAEAWRGLGLVEKRAGRAVESNAALADYLKRKPDATDRQMIAMMAGETM